MKANARANQSAMLDAEEASLPISSDILAPVLYNIANKTRGFSTAILSRSIGRGEHTSRRALDGPRSLHVHQHRERVVSRHTRDEAIKEALTAWVAQARRDAVIRELFEVELDSDFTRTGSTSSEALSASPALEVE